MTRFAKYSTGRKKPLDATGWKGMTAGDGGQSDSAAINNQVSEQASEHSNSPLKGVEHTKSFKHSKGGKDRHDGKNRYDKSFHGRKDGPKNYSGLECYNCHQKGHRASDCSEPSDGKHADIVCHKCKELGHKAFRCPKYPQKGDKSAFQNKTRWTKELREEWKKEKRSNFRREKRHNKVESGKLCFNCREPGHQLSECPEVKKDVEQGTGICFKCGSTEHAIHSCKLKLPPGEFPYAKCFICNETGHLSRQCPDNPRGLYPNGGCCNECGSVEHLKRDCPEYQKQQGIGDLTLERLTDREGANVEEIPAEAPVDKTTKKQKAKGTKIVKF